MKKSLVISTIATVLVVVVALTTATFAWFSTSSVSQASAEFVIDTSGGTIQITAWDKSKGPGTWAAAPYSGTDDQMPLGQYTGSYEWALTQTNGATGTDAGGAAENALTSYRPLMPVKEIDFTAESATEGSNGLPDVDFVNANQMASGIKVVGSQAKPVVARFRLDTIKANIDVNINVTLDVAGGPANSKSAAENFKFVLIGRTNAPTTTAQDFAFGTDYHYLANADEATGGADRNELAVPDYQPVVFDEGTSSETKVVKKASFNFSTTQSSTSTATFKMQSGTSVDCFLYIWLDGMKADNTASSAEVSFTLSFEDASPGAGG